MKNLISQIKIQLKALLIEWSMLRIGDQIEDKVQELDHWDKKKKNTKKI
jgi:hypothetical protein